MIRKPSLSEIDSVLENELRPCFSELESLRDQARMAAYFGAVIVVAGTLFCFLFAPRAALNHANLGNFFYVPVGLATLAYWFFSHFYKPYRKRFKEEVMRKAFARFFPSLAYEPEQYIDRSTYDEANFFSGITEYSGNDYCKGQLGEVKFSFSELTCIYESGSGKNRRRETVFQGFFFVGDFDRDFFFRTTIQPDMAENLLGFVGRGLQRIISGNRLVDLENPEFEKVFVVTSDDQVEARFILTPTMMEKIVDFKKRLGHPIHLCFVNGKMFLAIETSRDYFEPKLFGDILGRRDLMEFIDMLSLLVGVAEEFLHHPKFGNSAAVPPRMPMPPLPKPLVQKPTPEKMKLMPWLKRK
jgi:hypothetical protein